MGNLQTKLVEKFWQFAFSKRGTKCLEFFDYQIHKVDDYRRLRGNTIFETHKNIKSYDVIEQIGSYIKNQVKMYEKYKGNETKIKNLAEKANVTNKVYEEDFLAIMDGFVLGDFNRMRKVLNSHEYRKFKCKIQNKLENGKKVTWFNKKRAESERFYNGINIAKKITTPILTGIVLNTDEICEAKDTLGTKAMLEQIAKTAIKWLIFGEAVSMGIRMLPSVTKTIAAYSSRNASALTAVATGSIASIVGIYYLPKLIKSSVDKFWITEYEQSKTEISNNNINPGSVNYETAADSNIEDNENNINCSAVVIDDNNETVADSNIENIGNLHATDIDGRVEVIDDNIKPFEMTA